MRLLLCLCIVLLVFWSAVQGNGHHGRQPHPRPPGQDHGHGRGHGHGHGHSHGHGHEKHHDEGSLKIHRENMDFAFRLYEHISAQNNSQSKNVFFSPLSVSVALAALSLGARGQTNQQLFEGLGFNGTDLTEEEVNEAFQHIFQDLNKKTGVDLSLGSALFADDNFKPRTEFLESMKRYYQAEGFSTDFLKAEEAKEQINKYVEEKTKGKIAKLVDELDPETVMFLVSYIYFKGKWEVPFEPDQTKAGTFHVDDKTNVTVQMMTEKDHFHVYHDEEISTYVLQLHYNESISMLLVLPEKGMKGLEEVICREHVAKWLRWMKKRECKVFLPKFSISASLQLKDILTEMGFTDMFSNSADFSGITEDHKVKVSKFVHQATLDVDEVGATATGATGVGITLYSLRPFITLKFNRPFMVIICDQKTKSILFLGKIVDPTEK
ncbi:alpha-1-antitrypsin-like protein CM55-SI [Megalops cyprinoides]|uniref:alpha-1-antitrypsin-like protein CM55-SI n=1 Tax=Megalops cyprinoides TaxID=118141 RepID=UPI0018649F29|nr:alpha-1-antitrypsin-like protein CM55-SI [Megalops cyprinoides]